ncbi:MAG: ABC transporter ATP-binding protein [Holophagales bacterium]|nr:ABC transporter ATP-binding protein [Holophagales bacterium]
MTAGAPAPAGSGASPGAGEGATPSVVVTELRKIFYDQGRGQVRAVDGVSFTCRPGEIFGLLGANGAGKTTTLRMLATILRPTDGEALVLGHSVRYQPAQVRRSLGFYSASTALYPKLTARETLELFARINRYPEPGVAKRVDSLIERFGIGPFAKARVEKLSTGMKQKVSLARTLAHDPPVLIFDEPTVGLDVLSALALLDVVRELRDEGKTILYSTHILSEAEKLCDRIAILHAGRILDCDTLEGLRASTGEHYLEDIFVRHVTQADAAARRAPERRETGAWGGSAEATPESGRHPDPEADGG